MDCVTPVASCCACQILVVLVLSLRALCAEAGWGLVVGGGRSRRSKHSTAVSLKAFVVGVLARHTRST